MFNKFFKLYPYTLYLLFIIIINVTSLNEYEITNIIVIPFKTLNQKDESLFNITTLIKNNIYIELNATNQKLIATFDSDEFQFYMTSEGCPTISNYLIQKSPSFYNVSYGLASERFFLYRNYELTKYQYGLFGRMIIKEYNNKIQCAVFGLGIDSPVYEYKSEETNFIGNYKSNGNINSTHWTIKYTNNDEGLLIMGDSPNNYDPMFKDKKYKEYQTKAIIVGKTFFGIQFDDIIINKTNIGNTNVLFYHELGAVLVDQNFFENIVNMFFQKFLDSICTREWIPNKYSYIHCNSDKFTKSIQNSFPTIYFKSIEMEYIFELSSKDLFSKQKDGNTYFLVIFDLNIGVSSYIKIGKPFLKKYTLTADNSNKKISLFLVDNDDKKGKNKNLLIIIILSVIIFILSGLLSFFVYKLIKNSKKTKKRANELDEDYDYLSKDYNINNNLGL